MNGLPIDLVGNVWDEIQDSTPAWNAVKAVDYGVAVSVAAPQIFSKPALAYEVAARELA